ncbi:unnamed protein product [Rotaria magnacalcarata]|uniref:Uncharacterized protein n=4 Tax=Rotaria magnacalcarata TaxID=392030 RepID=A0A818ZU35_9BILA|nr:unnamed protein product [Rotaria magnacalcarata]
MKRVHSSNNSNQNINSSQAKRIRSSTPIQEEKSLAHFPNNGTGNSTKVQNKKKVINAICRNGGQKKCSNENFDDDNSQIAAYTPSGSSISFSSSSRGGGKENHGNLNTSLKSQRKHTQALHAITDISNNLGNKSLKKSMDTQHEKSSSPNSNSTNNLNRTSDSYSNRVSSPSSSKNKKTSDKNNSSRSSITNNRFTTDNQSSSSVLNTSHAVQPTFPIHSLVEGSLEYREMKRLYLNEKQLVEDWRKDYNVLKKQVAFIKTSTIPRPTSEVLDWLHELLDIMKNNGAFKGDGRSLNKIGQDLGLDETSLISVAARTPQKSALKLFRLLYPTVGSRAECGSISKVPPKQLENIYIYVRSLHKNLSFTRADMRKAIGTSIRSATCELRKLERNRQHRFNDSRSDDSMDFHEFDKTINIINVFLDEVADVTDDVNENEHENEDDDDGNGDMNEDEEDGDIDENEEDRDMDENENEGDDDEKEENNMLVDDEVDEEDS